MNKITPLLSFLILAIVCPSNVFAADSTCEKLILVSGSKSRSSETELGSYLTELFNDGVISRDELILIGNSLESGITKNLIMNPESSIERLIASDTIQELASKVQVLSGVVLAIRNQINRTDELSAIQDAIQEDVSQIYVRVAVGDQELEELAYHYFIKPESVKDAAALRILIERADTSLLMGAIPNIFYEDHWLAYPELLKLAIERAPTRVALETSNFHTLFGSQKYSDVFSKEISSIYPELLRMNLKKEERWKFNGYLRSVFSKPYWSNHPELLWMVLRETPYKDFIEVLNYVFSKPFWSNQPTFLRYLIGNFRLDNIQSIYFKGYLEAYWLQYPELFRLAIERASHAPAFNWNLFVQFTPDLYRIQHPKIAAALDIVDTNERLHYLNTTFGPYSWEGTEQENPKEYLDKVYGRIDE